MSREIKFRAWNEVTKSMDEISQIIFLPVSSDIPAFHGNWAQIKFLFRDDWLLVPQDVEIEQLTGLKDKNGKDLDWWEGDMFEHFFTDYPLIMIFEEGCFWFKITTGNVRYKCYDVIAMWKKLPKKIGSIHENPGLLGEEK